MTLNTTGGNSFTWTGRDDSASEGPNALRWHQRVAHYSADAATGKVLIGFCSDEGVRRNGGRIGAAAGPEALRSALANLAWHGRSPLYDTGDIVCADGQLEVAQQALADQVASVLRAGHQPLVMGGGHDVAWGTWQGIVASSTHLPRIGIINVDAHFDLRQSSQAHSGTPFAQIHRDCVARQMPFNYLCLGVSTLANTAALFDTANVTGTTWILDEHFTMWNRPAVENTVAKFLGNVDLVYLTLCLDAFPASIAPGVSAPAARGVEIDIVEWLIDLIHQRGRLHVAEIAELNPQFDQDHRSAKLAARLLARCAGAATPSQ
jgi:formiminoglutamase